MQIKNPICFAAGDDAIDTATAVICFRIGSDLLQNKRNTFEFQFY
jgi:hypothetical protein